MMPDSRAIQVKTLKDELKTWEKQFAAANDGKKPSREDIKANADIAAKYKSYNSLSKPTKPAKPSETQMTPSKKRRPASVSQPTPTRRKAAPVAQTPLRSNTALDNANDDDRENDSPSKQPVCNIIGPTPNKDGRVLGLFDCMMSVTPRKGERSALGEVAINVAQTPSRRPAQTLPMSASPARPSRTPQSPGKRFMLDAFVATPSKRLRLGADTPTSRHLQTPSALGRRIDGVLPAQGEASPVKVQPFKRRSFGRSLSSMIRDMKQQEEKALDDELELLREMESGVVGGGGVSLTREPREQLERVDETQVEMFDEDAMAALEEMEREEREAAGAEAGEPEPLAQPVQRVWKKKGLKRQTKRVIMRPVQRKPAPAATSEATSQRAAGEPGAADSEDELSNSEWTSDAEVPHAATGTAAGRHETSKQPVQGRKPLGTINPNAAAHANFRSLKIKNKNSRTKGRGRFGRGR